MTHTPDPSPAIGVPSSQVPPDQPPNPGREWIAHGDEALAEAYAKAIGHHGEYDRQRVRARISEEIQNLVWQSPWDGLPMSTALFLQAVIPQMPTWPVTALAINGVLEYPDGPELATLGLYGVEGLVGASRWRIYVLDLGVIGIPLALDRDVPHPALEPFRRDDTQAGQSARAPQSTPVPDGKS